MKESQLIDFSVIREIMVPQFILQPFQSNPGWISKWRLSHPKRCQWVSWGKFGGNVFQKLISKVVSTHLWNTPLNLYQQAINGIPFIVGQGDCPGCALGVCCNFLGWWETEIYQDSQSPVEPCPKVDGSWFAPETCESANWSSEKEKNHRGFANFLCFFFGFVGGNTLPVN